MSFNKSLHSGEIVFVRLLIPLSAGIFISDFTANDIKKYIAVLLAIIFCLLYLANLTYTCFKIYDFKQYTGFLFYSFIFILGILSGLYYKQCGSEDYFGNQKCSHLQIQVDAEPQQKSDIILFSAKVLTGYQKNKAVKLSGRLLIAFRKDPISKPINLQYGDVLMVPAKFSLVEPPFNPSEFDVQAWQAKQNIYHHSFLPQNEILILGRNKGNFLIRYALRLRQKQIDIYRRLLKKDEVFAVASTLILGYRADLSVETLRAYSKTGTIHALSVSGMHVGIIYMVLDWMLTFMDRNKNTRIFKVILILILIWFYSLLTGFCPAVLRSAIMLSVFILGKSFRKNINSYNVMAFSAFILLYTNPFILWDVGFQLSFLSVFGLVYVQPKISRLMFFKNKWADKLWGLVSLSTAAQLVTFPLSIYYFHQFPVCFLLGNLFILLPATLILYLGLVILLFRIWILAPAFEWLITFTNSGLNWIAELPLSSIAMIWISKTELCLLSLVLLFLLLACAQHNKKLLFIGMELLLVFQSLLMKDKIQVRRQQQIVFFSLKNNYAAAFISSDTAIVITDLKLNTKTFNFFVQPALDQRKISKLHLVNWTDTFKTSVLSVSAHQITFHRYHILKFDRYFNHKQVIGNPIFDLIWLHNRVQFKPAQLKKQMKFKVLIADASNSSHQLKNYTDSANIFHIEHHILKKNKGYLVNLTDDHLF